jgi:DNA-binding NtrC family response regulator
VPIRLPSLCERLDEIPHLVATCIEKSRNKIGHFAIDTLRPKANKIEASEQKK